MILGGQLRPIVHVKENISFSFFGFLGAHCINLMRLFGKPQNEKKRVLYLKVLLTNRKKVEAWLWIWFLKVGWRLSSKLTPPIKLCALFWVDIFVNYDTTEKDSKHRLFCFKKWVFVSSLWAWCKSYECQQFDNWTKELWSCSGCYCYTIAVIACSSAPLKTGSYCDRNVV